VKQLIIKVERETKVRRKTSPLLSKARPMGIT
jgi:hypothetical protein